LFDSGIHAKPTHSISVLRPIALKCWMAAHPICTSISGRAVLIYLGVSETMCTIGNLSCYEWLT
jgi:hypothetical protein